MVKNMEEILYLIAEFYKQPSKQLFEEINSGQIAKLWNSHNKLVFQNELADFKCEFSSFADMKKVFSRCFLDHKEPVAPPIESLYKIWTTDPSAESPIANETGFLYGDAAVHVKYLYTLYNLEIPDDFRNKPDHLCLQLEFLAFLINEDLNDEAVQYINDHFDWLIDFNEKLKKVPGSQFYVWLTSQLDQIIKFLIKKIKKHPIKFAEGE